MSDFNYQPLYGANKSTKPRVLMAQFGDGYEQRIPDGINTQKQIWGLIFTDSATNIMAIDAFLQLKNGSTNFTWTPQGASEIKVLCREWNLSRDTIDTFTLQATFEQVFE